MMMMMATRGDAKALADFKKEYERLDREVYDGALHPWPGVQWVEQAFVWASTHFERAPKRLHPFRVSRVFARTAVDEVWWNTIRHEIAHAAAFWLDGTDEGSHGYNWQYHAVKCGAIPLARPYKNMNGVKEQCPNFRRVRSCLLYTSPSPRDRG